MKCKITQAPLLTGCDGEGRAHVGMQSWCGNEFCNIILGRYEQGKTSSWGKVVTANEIRDDKSLPEGFYLLGQIQKGATMAAYCYHFYSTLIYVSLQILGRTTDQAYLFNGTSR